VKKVSKVRLPLGRCNNDLIDHTASRITVSARSARREAERIDHVHRIIPHIGVPVEAVVTVGGVGL